MNLAPTQLFHLEAAVRPCAVRWLTSDSIIVCRTSGTVELQAHFNSPAYNLYRTGFGTCRLQRIPNMTALLVLSDGRYEIIQDGNRGLTMNAGVLPANIGPVCACAFARTGPYLLASRDGTLWLSSDGIEWSSSGRLTIRDVTAGCVVSDQRFAFASAHGEVELIELSAFSIKTKQRIHADAVQDMVALDADTIVTVGRDRALRVWQPSNTFELLWSIPNLHEHFINCAALVGSELWTGCSDGTIAIVSLESKTRIALFRAHADAVRTLDLSPDGTRVISLSDDATYNIYEVRSRNLIARYGDQRQYTRSGDFLFHADGVRAAIGSTSGFLSYGKIEAGLFSKIRISSFSLRAVRYVDDNRILCGDDTGVLWLIDLVRGRVSASIPTGAGLTTIRLNAIDQSVLCGYRDGFIRVFSLHDVVGLGAVDSTAIGSPLTPRLSSRVHESIVGDVVPLSHGLVLSCSDDQTIKTGTIDFLSTLKTTSLDGTAINNLLLLSDMLMATTDGGTVFVLDRSTYDVRGRYTGHGSPVRAIAKISDSLVATGDRLGYVRIWNVDTLNTISANPFRERVIELGYSLDDQVLYVITEAEVAGLKVDNALVLGVQTDTAVAHHKDGLGVDETTPLSVATPLIIPASYDVEYDVEVAKVSNEFQLTPAEDYFLRKFVRFRGGTRCVIGLLSGGLSSARVFRATVFDGSGGTRINAVAKIGPRADIETEAQRYDAEIARLSPGATPRRIGSNESAAENTAGVFYSLAEGYDRSEFQVAVGALATASHVVDQVRVLTAPWSDRVPECQTTISDIRRRYLDDATLKKLVEKHSLDWIEEFELRRVQVRRCTTHGDLHGGNILVNDSGTPIIIDYGEVGDGPASFDPITLEFSHLFHPDGPLRGGKWPTPEQARMWRSQQYLHDCPMPEISKACWRWAEAVCAGHREIAAAAYAYLILQLKYPDTSKDLALNLLVGVRTWYDST